MIWNPGWIITGTNKTAAEKANGCSSKRGVAGFSSLMIPLFLFPLLLVSCSLVESLGGSQPTNTYKVSHLVSDGQFEGRRLQSLSIREMVEHQITNVMDDTAYREAGELSAAEYAIFFVLITDDSSFNPDGWPYDTDEQAREKVRNDSINFVLDIVRRQDNMLVHRGTAVIDKEPPQWVQTTLPEAVKKSMRDFR